MRFVGWLWGKGGCMCVRGWLESGKRREGGCLGRVGGVAIGSYDVYGRDRGRSKVRQMSFDSEGRSE